jgi:hypothetical protein
VILVLAVIGGEVDEPAIADAMKFRGPDSIAVGAKLRGTPNANSRVLADGTDGLGFADPDAFVVPALAIIVEALVEDHPRVRRVRWQYWVDIALTFNCLQLTRTPFLLN